MMSDEKSNSYFTLPELDHESDGIPREITAEKDGDE